MNHSFPRTNVCILALLFAASACGSDDDDPAASSPTGGRGTATCNTWQTALCNFADRCGTASRAACERTAKSITCKSDEVAADCASKLDDASCTAPPASCDSRDLADPAFAIASCNQFVDSVCATDVRCGATTMESCVAQQHMQIDCSKSVGVTLDFEDCLTKLDALTCGSPPPGVCMGVILQ